jgi:hypothetical protein
MTYPVDHLLSTFGSVNDAIADFFARSLQDGYIPQQDTTNVEETTVSDSCPATNAVATSMVIPTNVMQAHQCKTLFIHSSCSRLHIYRTTRSLQSLIRALSILSSIQYPYLKHIKNHFFVMRTFPPTILSAGRPCIMAVRAN